MCGRICLTGWIQTGFCFPLSQKGLPHLLLDDWHLRVEPIGFAYGKEMYPFNELITWPPIQEHFARIRN